MEIQQLNYNLIKMLIINKVCLTHEQTWKNSIKNKIVSIDKINHNKKKLLVFSFGVLFVNDGLPGKALAL